jgi:hypothetical protein
VSHLRRIKCQGERSVGTGLAELRDVVVRKRLGPRTPPWPAQSCADTGAQSRIGLTVDPRTSEASSEDECGRVFHRTCISASSTNRQSALIKRIWSMVRAQDSSRRGLATTKARHIARETATLSRFRLARQLVKEEGLGCQ